jgi:LacI family transcriptional regulator
MTVKNATKSSPTIVDIARKLKLSAMTVSRALRDSADVSEKTRQRVLACAKSLDYRPNRWARSLVTRQSMVIGVVIPDISHSFFAEITHGIEEIVEQAGYDILLCHSRNDSEREISEIRMLVGSRVDGLIVASVQPERSADAFLDLRARNIPFVLVDRFFPGHAFPSVHADDRSIGRMATNFLIDLGHRRLAHIAGPAVSPGSLRRRGFLDSLKAAGIARTHAPIVQGDFSFEAGRKAMSALLEEDQRPAAVFASNDPMAIGAVHACREAGLEVPKDISIVGVGNIEGDQHPTPFLTTVDWPRDELGRTAARLLLEAFAAKPEVNPVRIFKSRLLVRKSTAPPTGNR